MQWPISLVANWLSNILTIRLSGPNGKNVLDGDKAKGIIATSNMFSQDERAKLTRIIKTEGPSDLLSLIPLLQPGEGAFCNPCGAKENRAISLGCSNGSRASR